jgi:hypothetical protein
MKKIILSLILFFNLFCVFAETGYNGLYWGMPEDKAYWKMDFIDLKYSVDRINIYRENSTSDFYYFLDDRFIFVVKENNLIQENKLELKQKYVFSQEDKKLFFDYYEKNDITYNQIKDNERQKYKYFLVLAILLVDDLNKYSNNESENFCSIEYYQYNEDSMLIKVKNFFEKDIDIISMNMLEKIEKKATGIKNVYWEIPYDKLLFEKQVVEDSCYLEEKIKILQENIKDESIYYLFTKNNELFSIIVNTKKDYEYIKNKTNAQNYLSSLNYKRDFLSNLSTNWGFISNEEISPYFVLLIECNNYLNNSEGSGYFNALKEKNISKEDAKSSVTIYQSTPETKAFVFENVIENENFIILLPSKE